MKKKVLIKDIAKAAGVSSALVSYVLSGKAKEARISPITANKIRKIAKKLDYQPNLVAQNLRSGKSHLISVIVADISNPFFGQLVRLLEMEADKYGYNVIIGSSDEDAEKSYKIMKSLVQRQTDGVILVPAEGSEKQLDYLKSLGIPFVLIDRFFQNVPSDYVVINNFKSTYVSTQSLIELGSKNIAYIRYDNKMQNTTERFKGYKQALLDNNLEFNKELVGKVSYRDTDFDFNGKFAAFIKRNPQIDAVMFSTNTLSIRGLIALKSLQVKIPEEMTVFCFDQNESYELFHYPINYVRQPLDQIAKEAVKILIKRIKGSKNPPISKVIEPQIIFNK